MQLAFHLPLQHSTKLLRMHNNYLMVTLPDSAVSIPIFLFWSGIGWYIKEWWHWTSSEISVSIPKSTIRLWVYIWTLWLQQNSIGASGDKNDHPFKTITKRILGSSSGRRFLHQTRNATLLLFHMLHTINKIGMCRWHSSISFTQCSSTHCQPRNENSTSTTRNFESSWITIKSLHFLSNNNETSEAIKQLVSIFKKPNIIQQSKQKMDSQTFYQQFIPNPCNLLIPTNMPI